MSYSTDYLLPQTGDEHVRLGQFFRASDNTFITMNMFIEPPTPIRSDASAFDLKVIKSHETKRLDTLLDITAEVSVTIACF